MKKLYYRLIKDFVVEGISMFDNDVYYELEYKIIKQHPNYNKEKWDEYKETDAHQKWAHKLITYANKQISQNILSKFK